MKTLNALFLIVLVALLAACTGSKKLAKQAGKLDANGMYAEAAELYLQSAIRNGNNVDAKLGLKKTGQRLLDDKLGQFFKAANMGTDPEAAVNAYLDAKAWTDRANAAGVQLGIPDHYTADFNTVKGAALVDLYSKGQALLTAKDYEGARATFAKIAALEPGYKDAASLQAIAYLEPLYQSATASMAAGNYRAAVADLDNVLAKNATYKDASAMRTECITKGRVSIAVLQGATATRRPMPKSATLQAMAISALANLNDPFLSVVDRDDLQRLLDEQKLAMSGMVDEGSAVGAGKLIGAQAVLVCTLMDYGEVTGGLVRSSHEAYEGVTVETLDKATGQTSTTTQYRPVHYTENTQANTANISFNYKLVNLETGEVMLSQVVDRQGNAQVDYAVYDGNVKALFPKVNGQASTNSIARRSLFARFDAPRDATPAAALGTELFRSTTMEMANDVRQAIIAKLH